jgi:hypothetical protein
MKRTTLDWARVDKSDLLGNTELSRKLAALEKKYDAQFKVVFDTIRELMAPALRVGAEQPGVRDCAHGHAHLGADRDQQLRRPVWHAELQLHQRHLP